MSQSLDEWRGEISADVRHVKREIENLPGQIDRVGDRMEEALANYSDKTNESIDDHDERLKVLERWQSKLGVIVVFGSIIFGATATAAARQVFEYAAKLLP